MKALIYNQDYLENKKGDIERIFTGEIEIHLLSNKICTSVDIPKKLENTEKRFLKTEIKKDKFIIVENSELILNSEREEKIGLIRTIRKNLMTNTDIEINKSIDNGSSPESLRKYRQSLRDITEKYAGYESNKTKAKAIDALKLTDDKLGIENLKWPKIP